LEIDSLSYAVAKIQSSNLPRFRNLAWIFPLMRGGSADAGFNRVRKRFWSLCCLVVLACATEIFAQGREWYWYRIEVTTVYANQYEDGESGVTIITRDCNEVAEGTHARLMISAKSISGWIAF